MGAHPPSRHPRGEGLIELADHQLWIEQHKTNTNSAIWDTRELKDPPRKKPLENTPGAKRTDQGYSVR